MNQTTIAQVLDANHYRLDRTSNGFHHYRREFPIPSQGFAEVSIAHHKSGAVEIEVWVFGLSNSGDLTRRIHQYPNEGQTLEEFTLDVFTKLMNTKVGFNTLATLCGVSL